MARAFFTLHWIGCGHVPDYIVQVLFNIETRGGGNVPYSSALPLINRILASQNYPFLPLGQTRTTGRWSTV